MMIWLELCTSYTVVPVVTTTSIILCFNKHWLNGERFKLIFNVFCLYKQIWTSLENKVVLSWKIMENHSQISVRTLFIRDTFVLSVVYVCMYVVSVLLVLLIKLSLLAEWLARKTPLMKPSWGEGIVSTKPRQRLFMIFLIMYIVSLFQYMSVLLPGPARYISHSYSTI